MIEQIIPKASKAKICRHPSFLSIKYSLVKVGSLEKLCCVGVGYDSSFTRVQIESVYSVIWLKISFDKVQRVIRFVNE